MKKHLPSILPALALLTLGGCATSSTLATTENDGMYYSASADKVTALAMPVPQSAPLGDPSDVANPDYNGSVAQDGSAEYYDEERYAYATPQRRNGRDNYRGGSLGYYSFPYGDPFFYGGSAMAYSPYSAFGYSPYGFYDPFYRPFYGYGGLSVNIGFGFGRPFYRPFGHSPYGLYDPYFAYGGYGGYGGFGRPWGGYYGYGNGFYGNGFYGNGIYNNGQYGIGTDRQARSVTYGPRRSRTGTGAGLADGSTSTGSNASPGRSRVVQEARFATPGNNSAATPAGQYNGRSRVRDVTAGNGSSSASGQPAPTSEAATRSNRYRDAQPVQGSSATGQAAGTARRWRVLDNSTPNNAPASGVGRATQGSVSQPERARRATYYSGDNGNSGTEQRRSYSQPSRSSEPSRSYSQPSRSSEPSRSYSQPSRSSEPSRSYSEPSRSYSSPSSSPSSGSSSGGGGGGGGGGRGRVR